jgi:hypothetical protein
MNFGTAVVTGAGQGFGLALTAALGARGTAVLAVEEPQLRVHAFDPGDMRSAMHQRTLPGEDISDRPEPATGVPAPVRLLEGRRPSGRHRAADLQAAGSPR